MSIKLGSLFDGIGGFPYSGIKFGITPAWASEIEPWPIKVTEKHFPNMKHLGDITQINGAEIEPVDIITFGSPCQDLSVAGKREGLAGERSGLFMDAIRIIRQMRTATGGKYPRFAVWENVPGAFSSNKGEDFRAVLEEIAEAEIPIPRSGKWATAGMVRTERVDVAWRTLDAQYWGVAQRRRRIFLVADFGGQCAGEILFVEEGLSGHFAESGKAREEVAATVGGGIKTAGGNNVTATLTASYGTKWNGNSGADTGDNFVLSGVKGTDYLTGWDCQEKRIFSDKGVAPTISGSDGGGGRTGVGYVATVRGECLMFENHGQDIRFKGPLDVAQPVTATFGMGGNNQPFVVHKSPAVAMCINTKNNRFNAESQTFVIEPRSQDGVCRVHNDGIVPTLNTAQGGQRQPCVMAFTQNQREEIRDLRDKAGALAAEPGMHQQTFVIQNATRGKSQNGLGISQDDVSYTLDSLGNHAVATNYAVRRLTPLECERLQGFLDNWTNIEGCSDTARYKAIGNSVAIPCVMFVLGGIARVLGGEKE